MAMVDITRCEVNSSKSFVKACRWFENYLNSCREMGFRVVEMFERKSAIIYTDYGKKEMVYIVIR